MRTRSVEFSAPGSYDWTPPAGVTAVFATLVGAGRGGNGWGSTQTGGTAGGAGEYVEAILIPITGGAVPIVVGTGGAGGNDIASVNPLDRNGADGTLSSVNGVILALPGYSPLGGARGEGGGPTGGTGGFGGNPAGLGARLGRHVGGAGGGEGGSTGTPSHAAGAGALAAGIATYSVAGGAGVAGGFGGSGANSEFGPGGNGASGSNLPGAATTYPGAGGGGASTSLSPGGNGGVGGAGGPGIVRLFWIL